jgi:hypothetical protein
MTLQLDIGENAQDYSEIAKQEHLSGLCRGHFNPNSISDYRCTALI